MKLSFTTLGCPGWTLTEIAERAREYGFDGVELRVAPDGNHLSPDAPDTELERAAGIFRSAGVPVMSVMGYCRFAFSETAPVAENQALMRKLFRVAAGLGAPFIRTFGGQFPAGADAAGLTATVAAALAPLAREAETRGITIGLETHDDWCAGARVLEVVRRVGSPAFGIVYDIFNAFHSKLEPWDRTYDLVKEKIVYCHLKDGVTGPDGTMRYVFTGEGDLPIRELLARFKRDGYAGYFSCEWEKKWHPELPEPEEAFPKFAATVRRLWAEV